MFASFLLWFMFGQIQKQIVKCRRLVGEMDSKSVLFPVSWFYTSDGSTLVLERSKSCSPEVCFDSLHWLSVYPHG